MRAHAAFDIAVVVAGSLIGALGFAWFYIPHLLVSTGVTGIALLMGHLAGWGVGWQLLAYNLPVLALGWRYFGRRFLLYTAVAIVAISVALELLPKTMVTADPLLSALFGGLLTGAGAGLILRVGGSTGGLDVVSVAVNRRFSLSLGEVTVAINGIIIALGALTSDLQTAMYTLVALYVQGRMVDRLQAGPGKKTALIICTRPAELAARINKEMNRGATLVEGQGAYTGQPRHLLICVLSRLEVADLRDLVQATDPAAFVTVLETEEVIGRWNPANPLRRLRSPG